MRISTYIKEMLVVIPILCITTWINANNTVNWTMTAAVIATFCHAQISDRLKESQQIIANKTVKCYWKLNWYFGIKEILWITAFIMVHTYAAIVGSVLFALYPFWRKLYRWKIKPFPKTDPAQEPNMMSMYFDKNGMGIPGTQSEGWCITHGGPVTDLKSTPPLRHQ